MHHDGVLLSDCTFLEAIVLECNLNRQLFRWQTNQNFRTHRRLRSAKALAQTRWRHAPFCRPRLLIAHWCMQKLQYIVISRCLMFAVSFCIHLECVCCDFCRFEMCFSQLLLELFWHCLSILRIFGGCEVCPLGFTVLRLNTNSVSVQSVNKMLATYLSRFSVIADNKINCAPVLTWMEVVKHNFVCVCVKYSIPCSS